METLDYFLPQVWFFILGLFLFLYVILDGFDLGVGILSLTADGDEKRGMLMTSLSNVWDANETWLVLTAGSLFGAFPVAYGTILNALYIPIITMVFALSVRAVAFEFRELSRRKWFWNNAFGVGSLVAALAQGFALGSVLSGIQVDSTGHFTGGTWDWLNWRSLLAAITLVQGYVLIGSTYLILKTADDLQETHYRTAKIAAVTTLASALLITITTPIFYEELRVKLFDSSLTPLFVLIPILAVTLVGLLLRSLFAEKENTPFIWTLLIFLLSFVGLGLIVFPYIIPTKITIYQGAAAPSSLVFMLVFVGFLIPVMVFYNIYQYIVFRGKVSGGEYGK
jgi:cytochrome bd ubiquinol oxidase subunit II